MEFEKIVPMNWTRFCETLNIDRKNSSKILKEAVELRINEKRVIQELADNCKKVNKFVINPPCFYKGSNYEKMIGVSKNIQTE